MKRYLTTAFLSLALAPLAMGKPDAIYQNPGIVSTPPTVDAVVFKNSGFFNVSTFISLSNVTSTAIGFGDNAIPFATRDTRYFTNTGTMSGIPGFRLDTATARTRFSAQTIFNSGNILGQDEAAVPVFFSTPAGTTVLPQFSQPVPSQVFLVATNVINSGEIGVGNAGVLQITAKNFTNAFGALAAGGINTGGSSAEILNSGGVETITDPLDSTGRGSVDTGIGYFVNPPGVYDLVWGVTNAPQATAGLQVDALAFELPRTPPMILGFRGLFGLVGLGTTEVGGPISQYASYTFTNIVSTTNVYFTIVLVNTNFADTNLGAAVRFSQDNFNGIPVAEFGTGIPPVAVVQYALATTDVLTGDTVTNAVYLIDSGSEMTNMVLYDNASTANNYDRPFCFEVTTSTPFEWDAGTEVPQTPFDPSLVYAFGSFVNNQVPFIAAEYGAQIGRDPETLDGTFTTSFLNLGGTNVTAIEDELLLGEGVLLPDPTNEPARIQITAGQADLTQSRIRAEGIVELNITNLIGAGTGASDWGMTDATVGVTNGNLKLANLFPTTFQRVRGSIFAWSATWQNVFTNAVTTNNFHMHVLVVDQALRGNFHSTIRNLTLTGAKSINIQNDLTVINNVQFNTTNLTINANVTLTQNAANLTAANAPKLKSLFVNTNGSLIADSEILVGYNLSAGNIPPNKRKYSVTNIVNMGTIASTAPLFQSEFFTNDGVIFAENNGSMIINAAALSLGSPGNDSTNTLIAEGDVTLSAELILATNSVIVAGAGQQGSLTLDAIDGLSDGVSGAPSTTPNIVNHWQTSGGFILPVKPAAGDLFGTEIMTMAGPHSLVDHIWSGVDLGPTPQGFANNTTIGRLVLNRTDKTGITRFTGAGSQNALYVDDLILTNFSFSDYRNGLIIDPNIKIYFANANADPFKLMEVYPNQLIWVSNFWGPNSTIAVPFVNSSDVCLMNVALATSPEIGFFGVPNAFNQPFVLNDPSNPENVAPCPTEPSISDTFGASSGTSSQSLTISVHGSGTVSPRLTDQQAAVGSTDTLVATPASGWTFNGWTISGLSGNPNPKSPVLKFTVAPNASVTANFIPNPFGALQGTYNGLFYDQNSLEANTAGYFTMKLNSGGSFSGHVLMGMNTYNFSSQFYGQGAQQVRAGTGAKSVTLNLQLDMSGTTRQLRGDVNGGTWDVSLVANLASTFTANNPSPLTGRYTMVLPGGSGIGDSFGAVNVSPLGTVTVAGSLADGASFSQATQASTTGELPFYAYAAAGKDTVFGWVNFGIGGLSSTNVTWIKPAKAGRYYPAGFSDAFQMIGSRYNAPGRTAPPFSPNPVVVFSGGDLSENVTNALELQRNTTYASGDITLSITNSTGVFSGRVGGQAMSGVMLQNQNSARGYFLGTNQSGAVLLQGQ